MKRFTTIMALAAAVMAIAALGASTASAGTVLCSTSSNPCPAGSVQSAPASNQAGASSNFAAFTIKAGGSNVFECSYHVVTLETTQKNGNPLPANFLSGLSPGLCRSPNGASSCISASMNNPGATLSATGVAGSGTASIGSASQPLTISFKCNFSGIGEVTCSYKATGAVTMTYVQNETATITGAPLVKTAGALVPCFEKSLTLNTSSVIQSGGYLSKATESVLCGELVAICPNASILPAENFVLTGRAGAGPSVRIKAAGMSMVSCPGNILSFKSTQQFGTPLAASTASTALLNCTYAFEGTECQPGSFNSPSSTMEALVGGQTGVVHVGSVAQPLAVTMTCKFTGGSYSTCTYSATKAVDLSLNYETSTAVAKDAPLVVTSGKECWSSLTLTIENYLSDSSYLTKV